MWGQIRAAAAAVVAVALLAPTQAFATDGAPESVRVSGDDAATPAPRPTLLERAGKGRAVVEALGDRLPEAAAVNRMSAARLRTLLTTDHTARLGTDGQLFFAEEEEALAADAPVSTPTSTYPASSTFALHSKPDSARTIYLDFNGATVSNTWWNKSKGMPARFYTGFTLDSSAAFSSTELAYIQTVWRIVAEKYAAFDVDVTTADPGVAGWDRTSSSDTTYGSHVLITDDDGAVSAACGGTCSGVALLGTFDNVTYQESYFQPAWVFSSKTSGSALLTAHTVAHEVGHNLGLNHDGDSTRSYSSGHSNWFPLMGSSAKAVGQFSKGEYANANNTEDDFAVMAGNGLPERADDHGDTTAAARQFGAASAYTVQGVIGDRTDRDVIAIDRSCATQLNVVASGVGAGASLDIRVDVFNAAGTRVAYADPASGQNTSSWPYVPTGMDASVSVAAGTGRYYVQVDGVGKGDALYNGYSDYASIGAYRLSISGCAGDGPDPGAGTDSGTPIAPTTASRVRAPGAPRIGTAKSGRRGGKSNATARWAAPASTGGSAVIGYRVKAMRLNRSGRVVSVKSTRMLSASARVKRMRLTRGRYRFTVVAYNRVGTSPQSAASRVVRAR